MPWEASDNGSGWGVTDESSAPAPATAGFEPSLEPLSLEPSNTPESVNSYRGDSNIQGGGRGFTCYNCGQEGHVNSDCPNPSVAREFTGTCRTCNETGHRANECPLALLMQCNNCKENGHSAFECKSPRKIEYSGVKEVTAEVAWAQIKLAAEEGDLDDILEAAQRYFKATPNTTYVQMEKGFRIQDLKVFLIALEKELSPTYTNMDLQGNLDKKYSVTWRLTNKPMRPKEKEGWPASNEENLERLANAGTPVDRGIPKCSNCDEMGHTTKRCPEEKQENSDKAVVKCFNCEEVGHRIRDCPKPRLDKFACRNCHQSGHTSKECPEPRSAENVECKTCNEVGHFSRDCPQSGGGGSGGACYNCGQEGHRKQDCTNERVIICANCDEEGHTSRECPKPRDYSRVKCSNCDKMGHTKVRCKEPLKEEKEGDNSAYTGDTGAKNFDDSKDTAKETVAASGGWEEPATSIGASAAAWGATAATGNW